MNVRESAPGIAAMCALSIGGYAIAPGEAMASSLPASMNQSNQPGSSPVHDERPQADPEISPNVPADDKIYELTVDWNGNVTEHVGRYSCEGGYPEYAAIRTRSLGAIPMPALKQAKEQHQTDPKLQGYRKVGEVVFFKGTLLGKDCQPEPIEKGCMIFGFNDKGDGNGRPGLSKACAPVITELTAKIPEFKKYK